MQKSSSSVERKRVRNKFFVACCVILFFAACDVALGATLSIDVSSSQVKTGDTVTATIFVNSAGVAINDVDAKLSVPSDMLEIQSVSMSGSVLTLWVEQPSFSQGQVSFNGGITNPGYTGASGKVISVVMKALKPGNPSLSFSSASVRANDGLGTNVLTSKGSATVLITEPVKVPVQPVTPIVVPVQAASVPVVPTTLGTNPKSVAISSAATPDPDRWYSTSSTTFTWDLPGGTRAVKTLFDSRPASVPVVQYIPPITSRNIKDIEDGIWYFHMSYQTAGGWSAASHRKVQLDTEPPSKPFLSYSVTHNGQIEMSVKSSDSMSGLARIVISAENEAPFEITEQLSATTTRIILPAAYSGKKVVEVQVFDRADNSSVSSMTVEFHEVVMNVQGTGPESIDPHTTLSKLGSMAANFLNSVTNKLKNGGPMLLVLCALLALISIFLYKFVHVRRFTHKFSNLKSVHGEMLTMMGVMRKNMDQDMQLLRMDRTISDTREAEGVFLKNMLHDVTKMEKVLKAKIDAAKTPKK